MAVAFHTHTFEIPVASDAEVEAGVISDKVVVPSNLGTAAVEDADAFATAAQGALADSALQDADIGTSVQAQDAGLSSIAGLTTSADQMIYTTGSDAYATTALTSFARTILDDAAAGDVLTTLGVSAFVQTILNDADAAAVRATLDLEPGVDVQAYSANLDEVAAVNPGAAGLAILADAVQADVRDYLDTAPYAETRTALKALDTTKDTVAFLKEAGREGVFKWTAGDFSTQIAADTAEGVYVKADAIASTVGAWVRQFEGPVNVKWFGANGDGVADDGQEIQAALTLAGDIKCSVFVPPGTYLTSVELKIPDSVKLIGAGTNFTTIKGHGSLNGNLNVITNSLNDHTEHSTFNEDIHIWDLTVDGNYQERSASYSAVTDAGNGSNIKFASVHGGTIRRVHSVNSVLHCFDIAASIYKTPGVPDKQTRPLGPSLNCTIEECYADTPWYDDAFTIHDSGYVRVVNCRAFMNRVQRGTPNAWQYGFEADEGSYNCAFEDCHASGFMRGFSGKAHSGTVSASFINFVRCNAFDCGQGFWFWDNITVGTALTRGISMIDCIIDTPRTDNPDVIDAAYLMEISHVQSVDIQRLTLLNPGLGNIKITGSATKRVNIDGLTIYGSATVDGGWPIVYGLVTIYSGITGAFVRVANVTSLDTQPRPIIYNEDNDSSLIFENIRANGSDNTKGMIRMPSMEIDNLKINGLHGSGWGGDVYDNAQSQFYSNFYRQDMGRMKWMTIASGSPEGVVYAPAGTVCIGRSSGNYWKKGSAGNLNTGWTQIT